MQTMVTRNYEIFFPKNLERAIRIMLPLILRKYNVTQYG